MRVYHKYLLFIDSSSTTMKPNPEYAHEDARVYVDLNNIQYVSKAHTHMHITVV